MATITNLWDTGTKKIPVEMLTDKHLHGAYRLCWLVIYYYKYYLKNNRKSREEADAAAKYYSFGITLEIAEKFSIILEEEVKRRKKKYQRPDETKLWGYLMNRDQSKEFLSSNFKRIIK